MTAGFQSRNRESSYFNQTPRFRLLLRLSSFNLVIENLLISTKDVEVARVQTLAGFNLVIENLLISTHRRDNHLMKINIIVSIS